MPFETRALRELITSALTSDEFEDLLQDSYPDVYRDGRGMDRSFKTRSLIDFVNTRQTHSLLVQQIETIQPEWVNVWRQQQSECDTGGEPRPRVHLFSASANPLAATVLAELHARLTPLFELPESIPLTGGPERWDTALSGAIHAAEGAVLLLDPERFVSHFVELEHMLRSRLACRGYRVQLVPAVFSTETPALPLGAGRFSRLALSFSGCAEPELVAGRIEASLVELTDQWRGASPEEALETAILACLAHIPEQSLLSGAARFLQLQLAPLPVDKRRRAVSRTLLETELESALQFIDHVPWTSAPEERRRLVQIIEPAWVDKIAAQPIADIALGPFERRAVSLNAISLDTARHYVRRSCIRAPEGCWPIFHLSGQSRDLAAIRYEIGRAAAQMVASSDPCLSDEAVQDLLDQRERRDKPIFATFPSSSPVDRTLLGECRAAFPQITFIVLTGDQPLSGIQDAARFLRPALAQGREREALGLLRACMA